MGRLMLHSLGIVKAYLESKALRYFEQGGQNLVLGL